MFDCSPSMMLLYHRPVPAKIPKRRSRAGKHYLRSSRLPPARQVTAPIRSIKLTVVPFLIYRLRALVSTVMNLTSLNPRAYYDIAKRRRRSVMKNDRSVTGASNAD